MRSLGTVPESVRQAVSSLTDTERAFQQLEDKYMRDSVAETERTYQQPSAQEKECAVPFQRLLDARCQLLEEH